MEAAIEELYTFYERIAYLAYLFLAPVSVDAKALSYNNLFSRRTKKELLLKHLVLADNTHFKWFTDRVSKEHRILSGYRHPLVHYKAANTFIKGSYSASRIRHWLDNAVDGEEELNKLHSQIDNILKFVNKELLLCHEAFEQLVMMCESLDLIDK